MGRGAVRRTRAVLRAVLLEASGRNRTPDKLPGYERERLFAICDRALAEIASALGPRIVVGIGAFAAARCAETLAGTGVHVGRMLHPSPASPKANAGWAEQAEQALRALGIEV
jgi:single-strand selective monofunctional uracil DNA glycosylase